MFAPQIFVVCLRVLRVVACASARLHKNVEPAVVNSPGGYSGLGEVTRVSSRMANLRSRGGVTGARIARGMAGACTTRGMAGARTTRGMTGARTTRGMAAAA